ncbi:wax ester/triacylglycerol synthase family O-acyltransferase [Paraconexibacter sp.]|uniref:wax ester/triacylglycerol synthase family O-acyltransferase n=1 Tax=Paraconexibacter sp. TaxID=2949640 RepID=UPI00356A275D
MSDQLTALDGTFLELEDADPTAHMHIGGVLVFERPLHGPNPTLEDLRAQISSRLHLLPRYRQRLAHPDAGRLRWQRWETDPAFDIARHVRHAALPHPGGWDELLEWSGEQFSHRLDRNHPLWEIVLLEGLAEGRWAMFTKTHHCLVDGVGSVQIAHLLLDPSPTGGTQAPAPAGPPPVEPARDHSGPSLPGLGVAREAIHAALHPRETAQRAWALAELLVRDELQAAPDTSLNCAIGPRRGLSAVHLELDEAQQIRAALGGTVNDVVLSAVTAGLRRVFLTRGEEPPGAGLRAMVPVNLRASDGSSTGNRISSLFVELPVAEPDPLERHRIVRETTRTMKQGREPLGADTLLHVTGAVPPVVHQYLAGSLFAKRLFNVTVTNVPGPSQPLYAFGSRMAFVCPYVPLAAEHAVGVAIISYDGSLVFGVCVDPDAVPDADVLADGIAEGLRELQRAAHAPGVR